METFQEVGLRHQTDKATTHFYMDTYEKYLGHLRDKEFVMWELGIAAGNSIRAWRELFPKAKIIGIDNNPDCANYGEDLYIGDQTDTAFLDGLLAKFGPPDVIIDDASHYGPSTIKSFKHLFPKMKEGGFFFVEDNHCFYDQTYGEAPPYGEGMSEVYKFFSGLDVHVDVYGRAMTGNSQYAIDAQIEVPAVPEYSRIIDSIHIHTSLRLFKRK